MNWKQHAEITNKLIS